MDDLEITVFLACLVLAMVGAIKHQLGRLHPLHFRDNPGPGIVRLGMIVAMGWIGSVLWRHADPSVTGIWVVFYTHMGYVDVKFCGQAAEPEDTDPSGAGTHRGPGL